MPRTLLPGRPYPLGANVTDKGINFALYSEHATAVQVCLFDENGVQTECIDLRERTAYVWHGLVRGIGAGQRYGYRVDGPWEPELGHRFNPSKLLVDPYAKAISGNVDWKAPIFAHRVEDSNDLVRCDRDDAYGIPKSVVIDPTFNWGKDAAPQTPLADSVIYEMHVKGFSIRNPAVPKRLRGTYAGVGHPASIDYLKKMGITAVELLPIHHFIDDGHLLEKGLSNYWGYNTLGFFSPMSRYSSCGDTGGQVNEFKQMVKNLHAAGIEVILDVVYNHTCEGNRLGPMLSFKGVCNTTYYRAVPDQPRYYMDYTGTGNTMNVRNPQVLKMIMDSLRYWVTEMHVDGFRFDLASALARELHEVSKLSSFFDTIHQDPTLDTVKLIAEPWDVGEGGYQVGNFPVLWAEWNGKYRDTVRKFWKGDEGQLSDLAFRLTGSSDLYQSDGRKPSASINFVTAHDGFTLRDLVSYDEKHNEANGEENRDGANDNESWNMGAEGATDNPVINTMRERQIRNLLTTLLLSQGVPMISGGDEVGRSQHGNNNAYCQDNAISWQEWKLDEPSRRLLEFTKKLIQLRRERPNLRRRKFFQDREIHNTEGPSLLHDLSWYGSDGNLLPDEAWEAEWNRSLAIMLNGNTLQVTDEEGRPVVDDTFLMLLNAAPESIDFTLPATPFGGPWKHLIDTDNIDDPFASEQVGEDVVLCGRSMMVLCAERSNTQIF